MPTTRPTMFLAAMLLAGCDRSEPVQKPAPVPAVHKLVVGFSQIGSESAWREAETASMKIEAQKRGIELKLADAGGKLESQIQALHSFLKQKVDAVILAPKTRLGFEPVLRELAAAKIPVVLVDRGVECDDSLYATLIASDFTEEGRMAARWLVANTGGDVRVAELEGTAGSDPAIERKKGFHEVVDQEPRIQVVKSQNAGFNLIQGKEVMEAILKAEQGRIDAVYAHNDDMAMGAIQAIEAAGKKSGTHVLVVSIDGTRAAVQAIVDGKHDAVIECNPLLGPMAFDAVEKAVKGVELDKRTVVTDRIFDRKNAAAEVANRRY